MAGLLKYICVISIITGSEEIFTSVETEAHEEKKETGGEQCVRYKYKLLITRVNQGQHVFKGKVIYTLYSEEMICSATCNLNCFLMHLKDSNKLYPYSYTFILYKKM